MILIFKCCEQLTTCIEFSNKKEIWKEKMRKKVSLYVSILLKVISYYFVILVTKMEKKKEGGGKRRTEKR